MNNLIKSLSTLCMVAIVFATSVHAQQAEMQNFRYNDKRGVNVFESPKTPDVAFEGLRVRVGASNTLQFQAIDHENSGAALAKLENNFNLATSNLDFDIALYDGVRMHLRTYLSSQHHPEPYVKGGYMQIDKLDFIQEGFLSELMDKVTIKVGHMEINYGDNHFRRSDNAQALYNPFAGNYLMDSFTTEVGGEVYYKSNGLLAMIGLTNGKLNQSTVEGPVKTKPSYVAKLGYDSQVNEDLRVRITGSVYATTQNNSIYLYAGDRAGSRYYNVITAPGVGNFRSGRIDPAFGPGRAAPTVAGEMTSIMINPFLKYQGVEFYGVFENSSGKAKTESDTRTYTQLGAELLYRFGNEENFYLGGRYNTVSGEQAGGNDISIDRFNIGGGWFLTNNILAKFEYVKQSYNDYPAGTLYDKAEFSGFMVEAVISF